MNIIPSLRGFTFYLSIDSRFPFNVVIEMRKLGMSGYFYYMEEIWKDIEGYEGLYQVSNLGRVKSFKKGRWLNNKSRILKPGRGKYGHSNIKISSDHYFLCTSISRIVGIHFIPNPDNLPCVLHIKEDLDENGFLDNSADNLFWGTKSDNMKDMIKKGRGKNYANCNSNPFNWLGKLGINHPTSKKINQYSKEKEYIRTWDSIVDVERELGIHHPNISKVCLGKRETAGGFFWRYL